MTVLVRRSDADGLDDIDEAGGKNACAGEPAQCRGRNLGGLMSTANRCRNALRPADRGSSTPGARAFRIAERFEWTHTRYLRRCVVDSGHAPIWSMTSTSRVWASSHQPQSGAISRTRSPIEGLRGHHPRVTPYNQAARYRPLQQRTGHG